MHLINPPAARSAKRSLPLQARWSPRYRRGVAVPCGMAFPTHEVPYLSYQRLNDPVRCDRDIVILRLRQYGPNAYFHPFEQFWGVIGEGMVRYWLRTNSFALFGVFTSVPLFVKMDQEMRPWELQTDRQTDAGKNDFIICLIYGTDSKLTM